MSPRLANHEESNDNNKQKPGGRSYGGGLWMDELVDKMMEQPSGYVGFRCTYKHDIRKRSESG
jgi:hypothetical protein